MEELFSNNLFAIYIIACIAVISYTSFKDNQRMFILYLFTYATAFFEIFRISSSLILLFVITFIFLEYLTDDTKKLAIITNLAYKACDYAFMMLLQYHFLWIFAAFLTLYISRHISAPALQMLIKAASVIPLFSGAHLTISQPFKIKSISEMCRVFEQYPPYQFVYKPEMQEKFDLICAFEDKTYFQRENSYSCISFEYVRCFLRNRDFPSRSFFNEALSTVSKMPSPRYIISRIFRRGYSTPEMQLVRTIGILRGYDKHKIQRKIFEVLYSKILFASLKQFHKSNTYLALEHYRHYLLYVYFHTVMTKINGETCIPLSSAFENSGDLCDWSMEGLFVACLGLGFRKVSGVTLARYEHIINSFSLNTERIKSLSRSYPQKKFPPMSASRSQ